MARIFFSLLPFAIILFLDVYAFQAFKTVTTRKIVYWCYWILSISIIATLILGIFTDMRSWPGFIKGSFIAIFFSLFVFKLVLCSFVLVDDLVRLGKWAWAFFQTSPSIPTASSATGINRSQFLNQLGIITASIPFFALMYGVVRNAYNYKIKRVTLPLANLPETFKGLKIIQISDIHAGSFTRKKPIQKAIDMINDLQADLVFFTGDLVNSRAKEAEEYVDIFGQIRAKIGVFSVTGNHDYVRRGSWQNVKRGENFEQLKQIHKRMGWQLLLNENHVIEKDGHKLAVIGCENWSAKGFGKQGDLAKACRGCEDADIKLLLSHDPSHWRAQIIPEQPAIDATFSGHTHGFQFGINFAGFQWSPAQFVYEEWYGLYQEGNQFLYVNPGFGFLGFPGRVGFLPEITLFELA